MNILLFAGTSDGRMLAERLRNLPVRTTICVATKYGGKMFENVSGRFTVMVGRMDSDAMRSLMAESEYHLVVDATHPYAVAVSANIRDAAASEGVSYLRLLRRESPKGDCEYVESITEAARSLASATGNIFLTTGTKELAAYTVVPGYAERMYLRILPTEQSIRECTEIGFRPDHIVAMQGPFSHELNAALIRQFDIVVMVTKDGGAEGGFPEKVSAAEETGVRVLVVGRPSQERGLSLEEILKSIRRELEAKR